jgi:SAM-dependent methyltransferase
MPNDENERMRLDVTYHAFRFALRNTLFFAPITHPRAILDVGTGTGIWAMDAADAHPDTVVIGTDLSPIQPSFVPPNLTFEIADADEEWTFAQKFDLVHTRIMNDSSLRSWPHFFDEAFRALNPGGWVECQEVDYNRQSDDNTIPPDSRLSFWEREWTRGMEMTGLGGYCRPELVMQQMQNAGFVNVVCRRFKLPVGPWPRDEALRQAGLFGLVNVLEGLQGLSLKIFTELLHYSLDDLEALLVECRQEVRDRTVHGYWPV